MRFSGVFIVVLIVFSLGVIKLFSLCASMVCFGVLLHIGSDTCFVLTVFNVKQTAL